MSLSTPGQRVGGRVPGPITINVLMVAPARTSSSHGGASSPKPPGSWASAERRTPSAHPAAIGMLSGIDQSPVPASL